MIAGKRHSKMNQKEMEELNELTHAKAYSPACGEVLSEPEEVDCMFYIDAIYHVDTVHQVFDANVVVRYRWRLTESQAERYLASPDTFKICKYQDLHPRFKIPNLKELQEWKDYPKKFKTTTSNEVYCESSFRVVGTFMEKMELESFPFDIQDITITLVCNVPTNYYILTPNKKESDIGIMREKFLTMSEWSVETLSVQFTHTQKSESRSRTEKSVMRIFVKVRRKWIAYFWRVIIIMAIINFCSLFVFCIDISEPGDRGGHIFTIMLTAVAFQFVVQTELPKLPYLTYLDYYVLSSYAFIGAIAVENFIMAFNSNEDEDLDRQIFWIDLLAWIVIQVLFCIFARYCIMKENRKLTTLPIEDRSNIVWKTLNKEEYCRNSAYWGIREVIADEEEKKEN